MNKSSMNSLYAVPTAEEKGALQAQKVFSMFQLTTRNVQKVFDIGSLAVVPLEHYDQL
jgi:hypothetical protein